MGAGMYYWKDQWEKTDKVARVVFVLLAILGAWAMLAPDDKKRDRQHTEQVEPNSATHVSRLRPEMLITFINGTVACLSKDELAEITAHAVRGETTKANAMPGCTMIPPGQHVKILSAEYNNSNSDDGIVEIVGEGAQSSEGAWAFTFGAEPVK